MKISIITATYNSYPYIADVLHNINSQTYGNIEFIIVDGGSTDGTLKEIDNCSFVTRFISEPDKGIYDALNKGIKLATGDVIGFLHSDDMLVGPTIISTIANLFETKNIDGVYGDLQYVDKQNPNKVIRNWKSCDFDASLLKKGWMPAHPTFFLKKEVYMKHGNFDLSFKIAADYDFMLRILKDKTHNFYYLPTVITKMRVGGASNRSINNIIQKTKEDYRAAASNKIGGIFTVLLKNTSKLKQFF